MIVKNAEIFVVMKKVSEYTWEEVSHTLTYEKAKNMLGAKWLEGCQLAIFVKVE